MNDLHEPLQIDPRKVARYERYLVAYAHLHALDPLEHRRREHAGLRFLAALRRRQSRFQPVTKEPSEPSMKLVFQRAIASR